MFKQIIFTVAVIAACALSAQAAVVTDGDCLSQVAKYLSSFQVDPRVQVLVDEMRKFFPTFDNIFERIPTQEFIESMYEIGTQPGCDTLLAHVQNMGAKVSCFKDGLSSNDVIAMAKSDESIAKILESTYACVSTGYQ